MSDNDRDSVSIGREIVRASQTLANPASANDPSAMKNTARKAFCIGTRVEAAIESSA